MKLDWFWIELGFHPDMPLPVMTMALIRAARDKRLAALKAAGAGAADIARLHFAFQEAKRFATDSGNPFRQMAGSEFLDRHPLVPHVGRQSVIGRPINNQG